MRRAFWITVMVAGTIGVASVQAAESKPIEELPADLARWSMLWGELPKGMYAVEREEGPLSAMTWGPVRGTVMVVDATAKAIWDAAKQDKHGGRPGVLLRYEF